MTGNPDNTAYCQAWAEMMVTIWKDKMAALNIGDSYELLRSFMYDVDVQANGDVDKIIHTYMYYGRMVDMGVGRGVNIDNVPSGNRKAKDWYSKAYFRSVKVLTEKQAELYGDQYQLLIREMLNF